MSIFLVAFTPVSVFLSGFRRILDFFTVFLCFMSIFSCPIPYFSLASGEFWTFFLFFSALCPFSPAWFRVTLWLDVLFGLFYCFSVLYVHFLLLSSVFPSSFRMILDFFPIFLSFMSIWKSTEVSGLRNAALRRIKRSAITPFLFQKLLSRLP